MTDIMIDLETLSTRADAAILSVGIAVFDIKTGKVSDTLYKEVTMEVQKEYGHIDPATVKWWLQRDQDARQAICEQAYPEYLYNVLYKVRDFLQNNNIHKSTSRVWSNGSSFDLVILRHAFQRHYLDLPWGYWQERDCRTICDLAKDICGIDVKPSSQDTAHHALQDAINQAESVSWAYRALAYTGDE